MWSPGIYHPDQVFRSKEDQIGQLRRFLDNGAMISFVELSNETIQVVLPRTTQRRHSHLSTELIGKCSHFNHKQGCSKKFDDRPLECQALIPQGGECGFSDEWSRERDLVLPWKEYEQVIAEFEEEHWQNARAMA